MINHWFDKSREQAYPEDHELFANMKMELGEGEPTVA